LPVWTAWAISALSAMLRRFRFELGDQDTTGRPCRPLCTSCISCRLPECSSRPGRVCLTRQPPMLPRAGRDMVQIRSGLQTPCNGSRDSHSDTFPSVVDLFTFIRGEVSVLHFCGRAQDRAPWGPSRVGELTRGCHAAPVAFDPHNTSHVE